MRHFGMEPRTTGIGKKEQNGDVEASNRALKRRIEQALLLRDTRNFETHAAWQAFVHGVVQRANTTRANRLADELAVMKKVRKERLTEYVEMDAEVSAWSTLQGTILHRRAASACLAHFRSTRRTRPEPSVT